MYALGVILYEMRTNCRLFKQASKKCKRYKQIMDSRSDLLMQEIEIDLGYELSSEFKDLLVNLVREKPSHRYSIIDVLYHPWVVNPDCATPQEV